MANDLQLPIHSSDPRLRRHIRHDARSAQYPLDVSGLSLVDCDHTMHFGVLDQGQIGKCTAEAATEVLGSDPFWSTLHPSAQAVIDHPAFSDQFYSDEETVNGDGPYPPQDNGSDGLTSAKVAQTRGLISGYQHTFTAEDALKGLQLRPFSWGTLWKSGMDAVNEDTGQVTYTGSTRGGHQMCAYKLDVAAGQLWVHQSWGAWGYRRSGVFWISVDDFAKSLADQGDVTFFVPLNLPAPTPVPVPVPTPAPVTGTVRTWDDPADPALLDRWSAHKGWLRTASTTAAKAAWQRGR